MNINYLLKQGTGLLLTAGLMACGSGATGVGNPCPTLTGNYIDDSSFSTMNISQDACNSVTVTRDLSYPIQVLTDGQCRQGNNGPVVPKDASGNPLVSCALARFDGSSLIIDELSVVYGGGSYATNRTTVTQNGQGIVVTTSVGGSQSFRKR